jgi:hypothetical protein
MNDVLYYPLGGGKNQSTKSAVLGTKKRKITENQLESEFLKTKN